jgi:hypothetical protein
VVFQGLHLPTLWSGTSSSSSSGQSASPASSSGGLVHVSTYQDNLTPHDPCLDFVPNILLHRAARGRAHALPFPPPTLRIKVPIAHSILTAVSDLYRLPLIYTLNRLYLCVNAFLCSAVHWLDITNFSMIWYVPGSDSGQSRQAANSLAC